MWKGIMLFLLFWMVAGQATVNNKQTQKLNEKFATQYLKYKQ